ncbi:putative pyrophosphatase [Archaeoglobus sulfaticallidus PM70-1]|uniref:Putative pyrophosphatase n=1 Tax=Archaeoglobus sulfaticallidus PM70-1 TaxID=387631 RepID=N0BEZ7_9EURY|nr:MazG nucleotide pyrophosphohydrolase domain-containing protein [Archaeoglobus sulfaticallidus]AGK60847.1 putative pyrophosphatase [Archaeoglobus sulfaticallidus PM70-1]
MEMEEFQKLAIETVNKIDKKLNLNRDAQLTLSQLIEELGELARAINSEKLRNKRAEKKELEDEFADVFLQLVKLADLFDVDLEKAVLDKIEVLIKRHALG